MSPTSDDALLQLATEFPAAADYLSTILLIDRDYGEVHNTQLSQRLGVSKPAVSQAVSRLKHIGLVQQDLYGVIQLTDNGRDLAETIVIRHYLIEHLLIRSVNYPWASADEEALRLQTVISGDLADHLYEAFGRPSVCPHGNPFPGADCEQELLRAERLTGCEPEDRIAVVRITEEGECEEGLLDFCNRHNIKPGAEIGVEALVPEESVRVAGEGGSVFEVPWSYARHLCVRRV